MTIYYVKQDNTVWGCGDAECCGEYYEEIDKTFVDCEHEIPEAQMTGDHLQGCVGGGPVLKWRKAKKLEVYAFNSGKDEGFQEGSDWGIEWQKERIIKQLEETKATFLGTAQNYVGTGLDLAIALIKGEGENK